MQNRVGTRFWMCFACGSLTGIVVAAIWWSLHHPFGIHWDEAIYLNEAQIDAQRLRHLMLVKLAGRILVKSAGRPPAYRILALPVLAVLGFHTTAVRLVSLICFVVSSRFVYLTTRRLTGAAASTFAVLIFGLSPVVVSASIWFSTEGPLYLATSAMLFYLFSTWTDTSEQPHAWIGLGLAIGLGLLSKASFLAVMIPAMAFWIVAGVLEKWGIGNLRSLIKAAGIAIVVAAPWWFLNVRPAVAMTEQARGFVSNSLGSPSFNTTILWLSTVCQSLLGLPVAILVATVAFAWIYERALTKATAFEPAQQAMLYACICAGVPIALVQLAGTNHLLRHISPAIIPLAVTIGALVGKLGWANSRPGLVLCSLLFGGQLFMILLPLIQPNTRPEEPGLPNATLPWRVLAPREQWDWQPLFALTRDCGLDAPTIGYLGMGTTFNPPQIERPWAAAAASTSNTTFPYPRVQLLWRYEAGPLDWNKVIHAAEEADFVLTAPHYLGDPEAKEGLSNRYNAEFASRLASDALFRGPILMRVGTLEPVELSVFWKRSLVCRTTTTANVEGSGASGSNSAH